jgi:hypothetical protein
MRPNDQVLVLAHLMGVRNGNGWFSPTDITDMYESLRIPEPASIRRSLGQLRSNDLARTRNGSGEWTVTPLGAQRVSEIIADFDYNSIHAELMLTPGADFMNVRYTVIPPTLAPAKWQPGVQRFLATFPFGQNVFCMTRFPSSKEEELPDPLRGAIEVARSKLLDHGLILHLASDRQIEDDLFGNVGAHMWACQYGIGLLEGRGKIEGQLNTNMLIELGSMLTMGRRCAILKDVTAEHPPTDLSGQIYKSVNFIDPGTVVNAIDAWVLNDLGLAKAEVEPRA